MLALTPGPLVAQTDTQAPDATPDTDSMGMIDAATPGADGAGEAVGMEQMMERCMAMMDMMGGDDMPMPAATPER